MKNILQIISDLYEDDGYNYIHKIKSSNKSVVICKDKRRASFTCGICGSRDIIYQGVVYCSQCENEEEIIDDVVFRAFYNDAYASLCNCNRQYKSMIYNTKCIRCGSIESVVCINCNKKFWKDPLSKIYFCKHCGLTINK